METTSHANPPSPISTCLITPSIYVRTTLCSQYLTHVTPCTLFSSELASLSKKFLRRRASFRGHLLVTSRLVEWQNVLVPTLFRHFLSISQSHPPFRAVSPALSNRSLAYQRQFSFTKITGSPRTRSTFRSWEGTAVELVPSCQDVTRFERSSDCGPFLRRASLSSPLRCSIDVTPGGAFGKAVDTACLNIRTAQASKQAYSYRSA